MMLFLYNEIKYISKNMSRICPVLARLSLELQGYVTNVRHDKEQAIIYSKWSQNI